MVTKTLLAIKQALCSHRAEQANAYERIKILADLKFGRIFKTINKPKPCKN